MTATIEKAEMTAPGPMTGEVLPAPTFDYTQLSSESAATLQSLVPEIKKAHRLAVNELAEIGKHLNTAKTLLRQGLFGEWLKQEFRLSERTAQNYMRLALLPEEIRNVADLPLSVLYKLPSGTESSDGKVAKAAKGGGDDAHVKAARRLLCAALDDAAEDEVAEALGAATITRAELVRISRNAGVLMSGADEAIKRLEMAAPVAAD